MSLDSNRKFWNREKELISREELRKIQFAKLKNQLRYEYENSIFFKKQFDNAGMKPEDVQTWEDFELVPMMTKDDQRRCQEESIERFGHPFGMLVCAPLDRVVRISATSGTTGMPTFYTLTKHDVSVVRELSARKFWRMGLRPGDRVLHAMALSMFTGGVPVCDSLQEFGACVIPVGAESGITRVLQFLKLCKPDYGRFTPSTAEYVLQKCPEILGIPARELGLKGILVSGEPGGGIPEVRKRIKEGFNIKYLFDNIGGSHNFQGYSCMETADSPEYKGMHLVSEEYCILEVLDPETKKPLELKDGVTGEMVYTYIDWEGTPLLRYRLGDILQVHLSPCVCGDTRLRFKIIGRADDMLIVKGINVYPAAVKSLVSSFVPKLTGELRILLDEPGPAIKSLRVQLEYGEGIPKEDLPGLEKEIREKMRNLLRVNPAIEFVAPNTLERTTHKTKMIVKLYEQNK